MRTKENIHRLLQEAAEEISLGRLKARALFPQARIMADLAFDSMDYATLMLITEQKSGIKIREDGVNWAEVQTLDQLADLFVKNSGV